MGVNSSGQANFNQALHWNGKSWSLVSTPQPGGTTFGAVNALEGVTCLSMSDCWAVGDYAPNGNSGLNEILHWNGKHWSQAKAPNPAGTGFADYNHLRAVFCYSRSFCFADGNYTISGGKTLAQLLRWNGTRWFKFSIPNPNANSSTVDDELYGGFCASSSDCWATGYAAPNGSIVRNEALRRIGGTHGKKWSLAKMPQGGSTSNYLEGTYCTSVSSCWTVGGTANSAGAALNEALRWNGQKWSYVSTPQPGGTGASASNNLFWDFCASAKDCWGWAASIARAPF